MPLMIHGKEYVTVAERVKAVHDDRPEKLSIETEVLSHSPVVVKATVTLNGNVFTGISAANEDKTIEKTSPYEVAETSAVGRALGFANYGVVDSIASADEMVKAKVVTQVAPERSYSMEQFDSGEVCKKCGSAETQVKVAGPSSKRPGSEYTACKKCGSFIKYIG